MKALLLDNIQEEIKSREGRIGLLDEKVVDFSHALAKEEIKSQETVVNNDYFLKISEPWFCRLPGPDQLMFLALWYCERTRSAAGHYFTIQTQKQVRNFIVNFSVSLHRGPLTKTVFVDFSGNKEKSEKFKKLRIPLLSFNLIDIWNRSLDIAEEVFTHLEDHAEVSPA